MRMPMDWIVTTWKNRTQTILNRKMKQILLVILLIVGAESVAQKPFHLGVTEEIESAELGEKRLLNIYLPEGYHPDSTAVYPVVYLLDGSAHEDFIHTAGLVQFLTMIQVMPKTIVVGISNVDRKRDFTFPTTIEADQKAFPTTGKSERFIAFIQKELQPFIEKRYKTDGSKTILGQSLGGLLATEILLRKPELFNTYLIVSPSLWWDNESLLKKAPELLKSVEGKAITVYVSVGSEGRVMVRDAKKLSRILEKNKSLKTFFCHLPKENHATILHRSIYRAFEMLNDKKCFYR